MPQRLTLGSTKAIPYRKAFGSPDYLTDNSCHRLLGYPDALDLNALAGNAARSPL